MCNAIIWFNNLYTGARLIVFKIEPTNNKHNIIAYVYKDEKFMFDMDCILSTTTLPEAKDYLISFWKSLFIPNLISIAGVSVNDFSEDEKKGVTWGISNGS